MATVTSVSHGTAHLTYKKSEVGYSSCNKDANVQQAVLQQGVAATSKTKHVMKAASADAVLTADIIKTPQIRAQASFLSWNWRKLQKP